MSREQQIAKAQAEQKARKLSQILRRAIRLRTSFRWFAVHDPDANTALCKKCDAELTAFIEHIRAKKAAPLPACPSVELWRQGEEFDEEMKMAKWNDLQRARSR